MAVGAPRRAVAGLAGATALLVLVAALGPSATSPPLGAVSALPPWDLGLRPAPWLVITLEVAAYLLGALSLAGALRAVRAGWRPEPRRATAAATLAVVAFLLVPPIGSADHLSYAAYGRIAAQGGDPYLVAPDAWRDGDDPITSAAQPPWQDTPSVYGPVATAVQAAASHVAGDSLRATVWVLQLLVGAGYLVVVLLLDRITRADPARRGRAAVLWGLNPLLLGVVVGGAHLDGLCAAAAVAALVVATRAHPPAASWWLWPLLGGVLTGVAAGMKLPYGAAGAALVWALLGPGSDRRHRGRRWAAALLVVVGAALVLVPAHLWAGPHVYDQARRAARFTSLATPWRPLMNALDAVTGEPRAWLPALSAVLAVVAAVALWGVARRCGARADLADGPPVPGRRPTADDDASDDGNPDASADATRQAAFGAFTVLGVAYLLVSPYVLPWYDALGWAPLAAVGWSVALETALLVRLTTLCLAYVPGLAGGTSTAEDVMLAVRRFAAPAVTLAVLGWVLAAGLPVAARAWRARAAGPRASAATPGPGRPTPPA